MFSSCLKERFSIYRFVPLKRRRIPYPRLAYQICITVFISIIWILILDTCPVSLPGIGGWSGRGRFRIGSAS